MKASCLHQASRFSIVLAVLVGCGGNATEPSSKSAPLRVGHNYVNGNCALNADGKLTGQCEGNGNGGCVVHEPDSDSPRCEAGMKATETRASTCSAATSGHVVSREHQCFFVDR